jgi:hypothetical protein
MRSMGFDELTGIETRQLHSAQSFVYHHLSCWSRSSSKVLVGLAFGKSGMRSTMTEYEHHEH